jgi:type IV pilus assembly protein PilB
MRLRLGEALLAEGLIQSDQLSIAIEGQQKTRERLGDIIIKMGFIQPEEMAKFIASHFKLSFVDLKTIYKSIDPSVVRLIPEDLSRRFKIIPISLAEEYLTIAMFDPLDVIAEDTIRNKTGLKIKRVVSFEQDILEAIEYCYHQMPSLKEQVENFMDQGSGARGIVDPLDMLRIEANDPPVVKYVHHLVVQAVNLEGSDIHIKPKQDHVDLRIRIDSILYDLESPPKSMYSAIVTRIKILAGLDIAERRLPQDGRFKMNIAGNEVDVRVSCFPTIYGESVVMRLLNTSSPLLGLEQLGMFPQDLVNYAKAIRRPYGLILVTGPTGSGKTTTLYTTLNEIKSSEKNMITLEDPVEYRLPFIQQTQVNPGIGLDFARGLRSILRQDPDVIMVGEIRDRETAEIAIHASLTGHLVFSTLHTNDAAGAAVRLINMGVEPYLLASSLIGVLAQRLVRKICPHCKVEQHVADEVWQRIGLKAGEVKAYHGAGCKHCLKRGYKGRTALFEVLTLNEPICDLISARASSDEIRKKAQTFGMKTLSQAGIEKMKEGITTIDDVLRVTQEFQDS